MLRGALIGSGIILALAVIPILHFVTIWFAPFIGGFVGGSRAGATPNQAFGVGLLMGAIVAGPIIGIGMIYSVIFGFSIAAGLLIGGFVSVYVGGLGILGAVAGGSAMRRQRTQ